MVSLASRKDRNNQLDASLVRPQNRDVKKKKKSSFYWNYFSMNNIVYPSARYFGSERPINFSVDTVVWLTVGALLRLAGNETHSVELSSTTNEQLPSENIWLVWQKAKRYKKPGDIKNNNLMAVPQRVCISAIASVLSTLERRRAKNETRS